MRGTFFLRLDRATKQVTHESYKEFNDGFITQYLTDKEAKDAAKKAAKKQENLELYSFRLHDIIRREDGGAVLVAEQYRKYLVCTQSQSSLVSHCSTQYDYNDVIVVNIDPEGNIEWARKLPKRQHSVDDGGRYSGFAVDVKDDKIYILYNDNRENLLLKPGDKVKQFELKGKNALVVLATVNADGSTEREALFSPEQMDLVLYPQDCVELHDESLFIYASRHGTYRFGLIDFE